MKYWEDSFDDESAASYMETYGEGVGSDTRHQLAKYLNPGERVLDVGCGPGWNFDHLLEYGPSVTYRGIDYSERFIRVASERVKPMKIFKVGDARKIPEPNKSFDVVILQDVVEHTNGYIKPVREALRVSRKRVIVTFWRLSEGQEDIINDDGDDTWGAAYSRPKWEKFLDSLDLHWMHEHSEPSANRQHDFYIIDKEASHG